MSNPNWLTVEVEAHLRDCPPWDCEVDEALIPELAAEICRDFDYTIVYDAIDSLACGLLRRRGLDPLDSDEKGEWTETERAAYNGLSSADYHNPL
jgi:hypothetical protein